MKDCGGSFLLVVERGTLSREPPQLKQGPPPPPPPPPTGVFLGLRFRLPKMARAL